MYNPKVVSEPSPSVHVSEMKDGDVAVIVEWGTRRHRGASVKRKGDDLVYMDGSDSWDAAFGDFPLTKKNNPSCLVRILPPGTTIQL